MMGIFKKHSSKLSVPKYDLNHFAVITVLFNPLKYTSRYELYHKFDEHMTRCGIILLTVECIFEEGEQLGLPKQKFEVTRAKDPRHLQIKAPSVLWLKENLINIAVKRLPSYIEYIAWLDADIEFERLDWPYLTIHELQRYPIVQLFQLSFFLGPSGKKQVLRRDYSFVYSIKHGQPINPNRSSECYIHPGYAWAMRREMFDNLGGLLDFCIVGSGDIHFAYGLLNRIEETIPAGVHDDYRHVAKVWGERLAQLAGNGTNVGYVPINIWHHWHGHRRDRKYMERWSLLEQYKFSPLIDLERNDRLGLIRFVNHHCLGRPNSAKRLELLEKNIINYFRSRDEDNIKKPIPTINTTILQTEPINTTIIQTEPINTTIIQTEPINTTILSNEPINRITPKTESINSSHEIFHAFDNLSLHHHTSSPIDNIINNSIDSSSLFSNYPFQYHDDNNHETFY